MMAGYRALNKENQRATFEIFVRKLPRTAAFLVFAGLEQAIGDLLRLAFSAGQIAAAPALAGVCGHRPRLL